MLISLATTRDSFNASGIFHVIIIRTEVMIMSFYQDAFLSGLKGLWGWGGVTYPSTTANVSGTEKTILCAEISQLLLE